MPAPLRSLLLTAVGLLALACGPEIGDECSSSAECGAGRTCDLNSAGGYCTIGGCTANSCPENSVCVTFRNTESWCMAWCETGEDCREEYVCDTANGPMGPDGPHGFCRAPAACMPTDDPQVFPECAGPSE